MRKNFLFVIVFISFSMTSVLAQNTKRNVLKSTEKSVSKSGKVPESPGSGRFNKFLEKKAKEARKNAEKKNKEVEQKKSSNEEKVTKKS